MDKKTTCIWADLNGYCNPREERCPYLEDAFLDEEDCEDYNDEKGLKFI